MDTRKTFIILLQSVVYCRSCERFSDQEKQQDQKHDRHGVFFAPNDSLLRLEVFFSASENEV